MILILSICLNMLFLYSVFDLHFRGLPLSTVPVCDRNLTQLTKRVVLAVSDGMPAELMYSVLASQGRNSSFFRRVMENGGTWGFSHTSIPSCSKPGFIAMTTGAKYDSSIFLSDLKLFPFEYDLVFNNIDQIFYSGDPSVASYTSNTDQRGRWTTNTWTDAFENSVKKDYYKFDDFAYEGLNRSFFMNKTLEGKLNGNKVIFIIWSVSSDYCGHTLKPKNCSTVVENLDKNMEKLDIAFRTYYGDNQTTFIFTSDHGMTDSGVHGGAFPSETICPLIAWGSGIRKGGGKKQERPKHWKTENMNSVDIEQIDIAVLITTLLGNPTPAHSSGIVQKDILDTDDNNLRNSLYCNQKQIYHLLEEQAKRTGDFFVLENSPDGENLTDLIKQFRQSYDIELAEKLILIHQKQLRQYKRYFNLLLWKIVTMIYLGWGTLILERQLKQEKNQAKESLDVLSRMKRWYVRNTSRKDFIFTCILDFITLVFCISLVTLVFLKNWPRHFSLYFIVLCLVWWRVFKNIKVLTLLLDNFRTFANTVFWMMATTLPICALIFGVSSVYARQLLVIITTFSLFFTVKLKNTDVFIWILSSVIILVSYIYEIIGHGKSLFLIKIGCLSWICFLIMFIYYKRYSIWTFIYFYILIISVWNTLTVQYLPHEFYKFGHAMLAWCILLLCLFLPYLSSTGGIERLFHFCFSFGASFILMCVRQEALGLLAFCLHVCSWFSAELREPKIDARVDIRRGFMLLFYTYTGYFAIGNTDYPNSFGIEWADSFVTYFQQTVITALLLYKTMIPQLLLAIAFAMMCGRKRKAFEWFLFLNNIVSLVFFLSTKGEGYHFEEISISLVRFLLSLIIPVFFAITVPLMNLINDRVIDIVKSTIFVKRFFIK